MKKKYTMEEFKEMFENAENAALEKLNNDMNKAIKDREEQLDDMSKFAFTMQNVLAMSALKKELFNKEER